MSTSESADEWGQREAHAHVATRAQDSFPSILQMYVLGQLLPHLLSPQGQWVSSKLSLLLLGVHCRGPLRSLEASL